MKNNYHTKKGIFGFEVGSQSSGPFAPTTIRRPQVWQSTALWMPFDRNHFTPVVSFGMSADRKDTWIHYYSAKTGLTALPVDRFNQRYCYYLKATTTESHRTLTDLRRGLLDAASLIGMPAVMRHDLAFLVGGEAVLTQFNIKGLFEFDPSPTKGLLVTPGYQIARG